MPANERHDRLPANGPSAVADQRCGVVMPISGIDGCPESHWTDVKSILFQAIRGAGFLPELVSTADDVGVIHKRIIENLYTNPVVVCDVSGRNPNVMFELGMRLAFDKPTIIIKDDATNYTFDTAPIEHLTYPRDLRFAKIVLFQQDLSSKIAATHKRAKDDPTYTPFLKHFGTFTVAQLETKAISTDKFVLQELAELKAIVMQSVAQSRTRELPDRPSRAPHVLRRELAQAIELLGLAPEALRDPTVRQNVKRFISERSPRLYLPDVWFDELCSEAIKLGPA